jgi:hypothetical protein
MKSIAAGLVTFLVPAVALACPAERSCCASGGSSWTAIALLAGVVIGAASVAAERAIAGRRKG